MVLRTADEMNELFADIPESIINTFKIAQRCNLELTLGENYLPHFQIPEQQTQAVLCDHCLALGKIEASTKQAGLVIERTHLEARTALSDPGKDYLAIDNNFVLDKSNIPNQKTDADGHFAFGPHDNIRSIVALHEYGFAQITLEQFKQTGEIILQPYGRIEGDFYMLQHMDIVHIPKIANHHLAIFYCCTSIFL